MGQNHMYSLLEESRIFMLSASQTLAFCSTPLGTGEANMHGIHANVHHCKHDL